MFIYNFKFDKKKLAKVLFIIILIIVTLYFLISAYRIYTNTFRVKDEIKNEVQYLQANNYTNILKCVHENIDDYIGKEICFTGYVYRLSDFTENQFVLARDMIISSDNQSLVVGFLCDCKSAKEYNDNDWVEITGKITKGNYHGDLPIIKISKIEKIEKPETNIYVYPPDDTYVSTVNML